MVSLVYGLKIEGGHGRVLKSQRRLYYCVYVSAILLYRTITAIFILIKSGLISALKSHFVHVYMQILMSTKLDELC